MRNRVFSRVVVSLFWGVALYADPIVWDTNQIPLPPSASTGVFIDVVVSPGPHTEEAVATWADADLGTPYYSIYNNGTWTTGAIPPGDSTAALQNVHVAAGPNPGNLIATWGDDPSNNPYYSLYDGSTWTTTGPIPLSDSSGVKYNVVIAPGPNDGEMTAAWANQETNRLYYSIYSGGTWTTGILSDDSDFYCQYDVYLTPGPTLGTMVATWSGADNLRPYYSIYSGGVWSPGALIAPTGTTMTEFNVIPTRNPTNGEITAVWSDRSSSSYTIYYSTYSAGVWSTEAPIPMGTSDGCYFDPYIAAEATGQLVVTWADFTTQVPYFSIYDNGVWSDGAAIPPSTSTGAYQSVTIARLLDTNTMIAAWQNLDNALPYYSTFVGPPIPPPPVTAPLPPTNGQGAHITNRFALLVEWSNQLNWTASTSPNVIGYNIKHNGALIATNVAGTTYLDSNRPRKGTDVYLITSVNAEGFESLTGLEITVTNL